MQELYGKIMREGRRECDLDKFSDDLNGHCLVNHGGNFVAILLYNMDLKDCKHGVPSNAGVGREENVILIFSSFSDLLRNSIKTKEIINLLKQRVYGCNNVAQKL